MIPRLLDDPAWARYEWELRHLAVLAYRQALRETFAEIAEAVLPAMQKFSGALAEWGAAASKLRLGLEADL